MGIEKMRPLARESVCWVNMKTDIENTVRQYATFQEYQQIQPQERMLLYELPYRPWEVASADIFMVNNKMLLCIVDYYSKFPVVKKVGSLAVDSLIQMTKVIFVQHGLAKKIVSNAGMNLTSEIFKQFCRQMSMQQSIHHPITTRAMVRLRNA